MKIGGNKWNESGESARSGSRTRTSVGHMALNHACLPVSAPGQYYFSIAVQI